MFFIFLRLFGIMAFLISGIVFFALLYENHKFSKGALITFITCALVIAFSIVGTHNLYAPENTTKQVEAVEYIVALQDKTGTEGAFYARRGYMSEELFYFYMIDLGDHSRAGKISANRTDVYEVESNFRVEWMLIHHDWWIFHEIERPYTWKLYVPKNTIIEDYQIDLG